MVKRQSAKTIPKIQLSRSNPKSLVSVANAKPLRSENKKAVRWTESETEALERGIAKYGAKNWKRILRKYSEKFHRSRRVVDLVNKYNLLHKSSSYYKTEKKDWIMVDSEGEPVVDGLGEIIVISQKFPYDAAKKFAKRRISSGEIEFLIQIREAENIENQHAYNVKLEADKINMKKIVLSEREN